MLHDLRSYPAVEAERRLVLGCVEHRARLGEAAQARKLAPAPTWAEPSLARRVRVARALRSLVRVRRPART
jgi:hypothetical protein